MKIQKLIIFSFLSVCLKAQSMESPSLVLSCQASDGSQIIFDRFENDPCRIRRKVGEQEVTLESVNLCIIPDDVHSDYSFWKIVPKSAKAFLVAELEAQSDGSLKGQYNLGEPETDEPWLKLDCPADPK